ncbi:hypothetical protein Taro_026445 [Colocasia esculenta]|uniref:SMP-LTD domain-containing protein n=1 Tax=Colocasia esculenta TaxID=4460 RepID=A0A843VRB4_COLES|nr:hypothetical protein [Colocasia esculenta]
MWGVLFGFLIGALAVLAAEAVALLKALEWLSRKRKPEPSEAELAHDLDGEQSLAYAKSKKGIVWLLETDKVSWATSDQSTSKVLKEQKVRKGIVEVSPTKKYARIENQILTLEDTDGFQEASIQLEDCAIMAVSGSNLPSRKWAKRYPLKVESKKSAIYRGSKTFYLFLETSWEKEAWCKALRLASCSDRGKWERFVKLTRDFHHYISLLNAEYPSFLKPSEFVEATDKTSKIDASSRVRYFLKRLAKKAAKGTAENKASTISSSNRGETRVGEKLHSLQDTSSSTGVVKSSSTDKLSSSSVQDLSHSTIPTISHFGSQNQSSLSSDLASSERFAVDEGTLCWNLLFSRLFFDAKRSTDMNRFIKERIQKSLSNMRTPSYIGGITCTHLDLGDIPLHIRSMRVLPMDLNDVWAFEVDVEYSGGILLDIETHLDVREPDFERGLVDRSLEPSTAEVTSDLLEGFEHYKNKLKCSSDTTGKMENKIVDDKPDVLKPSKSTNWASTYVSRWKAIVHSVAAQVSQLALMSSPMLTGMEILPQATMGQGI